MRRATVGCALVLAGLAVAVTGCGAPAVGEGESNVTNVHPASLFGEIRVNNISIPRLAAAPIAPAAHSKVDAFMAGFTAGAITDFRTEKAAADATGLALKNNTGVVTRFGDVAYVRPGLGNIAPSAAQVYLLAQHFGTVIVMHTNMTDTSSPTDLRPLTKFEGVPVPNSIAGKVRIFEIGSPARNLISVSQQSDVTLEQLERIRLAKPALGFDPFATRAWVFAHSQGVPDVVTTNARLLAAGLRPFASVVGIAGAIYGGRLIGTELGKSFVTGAIEAAGKQGQDAMLGLGNQATRDVVSKALGVKDDALPAAVQKSILFAFGGTVDPKAEQGNIRPSFLGLAGQPDFQNRVTPNDGVENIDSTTAGARSRTFNQADHMLMIEDPVILQGELLFMQQALSQ